MSILYLSGCGKNDSPPPLPQGEQTVTGVLSPVEISIVRRGTHILKQNGIPFTYVESPVVNLRQLEGKSVSLTGVFEHNTDPRDLPVLVVKEAEASQEKVSVWSLPTLGLTLETPSTWKKQEDEDQIHFITEDLERPILSVFTDDTVEELQGVTITVGGQRAVRLIDEMNQSEFVYIKRGETYLVLLFTPRNHPDALELKREWLSLLRSIAFDSEPELPEVPSTGSGAHSVYCGGSAGILCPSGYFCDITDLQENIGVCKRMN